MSEHFSLQWDDFHKNMSAGMQSLLKSEDLVDVTLAVEGRHLKAHKMVLSLCSPYFRQLFQSSPCQHPIVFMKDISYISLIDLLQFIYQGEVQVAQENLPAFLNTAEALQIKELAGDRTNQNEESIETTEATKPSAIRSVTGVKKCTHVRVGSSPSAVAHHVAVEADNSMLMKIEPSDAIDKEVADETRDSYAYESRFKEGCNLMETNEDDSKPETTLDGLEKQPNMADRDQSKSNKIRERVVLTIEKKIEICNRLENGENRLKIMEDYGISSSTVYEIRKHKSELLKFKSACENPRASKQRKMLRKPKLEQLDTILYEWFMVQRSHGTPISGPILKEKAKEFYEEMKLTKKCTFSDGWLSRFKLRHGIRKLDISGERKSLGSCAEKNKKETDF